MLDISSVSAVVAATSVVAGVIYYSFQIRERTRARQTDLVIRLYSNFGSKELTEAVTRIMNLEFKDYNDFVKKYGSWASRKPLHIALIMVANFFNEVGILLNRKLVDIGLVDDLFTYRVEVLWRIMKPIVEGARKQFNPRWAQWFEYLYNEMQKREQRLQQIHP